MSQVFVFMNKLSYLKTDTDISRDMELPIYCRFTCWTQGGTRRTSTSHGACPNGDPIQKIGMEATTGQPALSHPREVRAPFLPKPEGRPSLLHLPTATRDWTSSCKAMGPEQDLLAAWQGPRAPGLLTPAVLPPLPPGGLVYCVWGMSLPNQDSATYGRQRRWDTLKWKRVDWQDQAAVFQWRKTPGGHTGSVNTTLRNKDLSLLKDCYVANTVIPEIGTLRFPSIPHISRNRFGTESRAQSRSFLENKAGYIVDPVGTTQQGTAARTITIYEQASACADSPRWKIQCWIINTRASLEKPTRH